MNYRPVLVQFILFLFFLSLGKDCLAQSSTSLEASGLAYQIENKINALVDLASTKVIPAKAGTPGATSLTIFADKPVLSNPKSKQAWILVVAGSVGHTLNENPQTRVEAIWMSDVPSIKAGKAWSISASTLKKLQSQIKADRITLEQMYSAILRELKQEQFKQSK